MFKEIHESFLSLAATVEEIEPGKNKAALENLVALKKKMKDQLAGATETMSLLGTVLETGSSEILRYVKKRAG